MYGRGISSCHHNFCGIFPFSFNFAVKRVVGIAIEPQIPIKPVLGHHDFGNEGFDDGFGYILAFVWMGILLQGVLQNGDLLSVVHHFLGFSLRGEHCDLFLQLDHPGFQLRTFGAEQLTADVYQFGTEDGVRRFYQRSLDKLRLLLEKKSLLFKKVGEDKIIL